MVPEIENHRIVKVTYRWPLRFWYLIFELKLLWSLLSVALSFRPHWVFVSGFTGPSLRAAILARLLTRSKVATFFHHWSYAFTVKDTFRQLRSELGRGALGSLLSSVGAHFGAWSLRFVDLIYCDSDFSKSQLKRLAAVSDDRIVVTGGWGIDAKIIRDSPPCGLGLDAITVGRIAREKGSFDLVEIWSEVIQQLPQARVGVIGARTDEFDAWIQLLKEGKMNGTILYLGTDFTQEEMYGRMKGVRIFVFPTHREGWGIALAEAICCGLPAVCYDMPPLNALETGGIEFVPYLDKGRFAAVVVSLLKDDNKRKNMSELNISYASHFKTWDEIAELVFDGMKERNSMAG